MQMGASPMQMGPSPMQIGASPMQQQMGISPMQQQMDQSQGMVVGSFGQNVPGGPLMQIRSQYL